jgi:hypothetical protein
MKAFMRRMVIGLGAMLFVVGVGVFIVGHELLRVLISFAVEDQQQRENVIKAFGAGIVLAALGAGLLGVGLPRGGAQRPS